MPLVVESALTAPKIGIAPLDHDHRIMCALLVSLDHLLIDQDDGDGALLVLDSLLGHTMGHIEREMLAMQRLLPFDPTRVLHYAVMGEELSSLRSAFVRGRFWTIPDLFMAQLRALYDFTFKRFCVVAA